jgi:DNA-binding response OmpR family regulator
MGKEIYLNMGKILLLEDDANLNETVTEFLEEEGHQVISVYDGHEAQEKIYESKYDLLLLDVNTPGINGFELLKEARKEKVLAPAIFITSLDSVDDLEKGYASGCDDYIRKPFVLKELKIRVETLLKRGFFHEEKKMIEISKTIAYDIENNELIIDEEVISLGHKESKLLKLFMKNDGTVIAHERIYEHLWDYDEEPSDTALRTYIKNLRKIIGKEKIVSIKKQGYKFITGI